MTSSSLWALTTLQSSHFCYLCFWQHLWPARVLLGTLVGTLFYDITTAPVMPVWAFPPLHFAKFSSKLAFLFLNFFVLSQENCKGKGVTWENSGFCFRNLALNSGAKFGLNQPQCLSNSPKSTITGSNLSELLKVCLLKLKVCKYWSN